MISQALTTYRGECKLPGGKLVAVSVQLNPQVFLTRGASHVEHCQIDGDFFIDAARDQLNILKALEREIENIVLPLAEGDINGRLEAVINRYKDSYLIGINANTITLALIRALTQVPGYPTNTIDGHLHTRTDLLDRILTLDDFTNAQTSDFFDRWGQLPLNVIMDVEREPAEQIGLDLAMLQAVDRGEQPPSLRIWQWASPAVVIGRFQSLHNEVHVARAHELGFTVVRRMSGGGAMFAEPDRVITYSLYLPISFASGLNRTLTYYLCDVWLLKGLEHLGITAGWTGMNDIASPKGKIGGSAQRRLPVHPGRVGAFLHHDMLSYSIDADKMVQVLNTSDEKVVDKAVRSAKARIDPLERQTRLSRKQLTEALVATLPDIAPATRLSVVNEQMAVQGNELAAKYFCSTQWTASII
ncbi:lipoate--protein ligase family protein [Bombiscardovia coagulans]|uniref:Biotin/lipoate A/B protein ligase family n=1 Tax=Bombiscardovia coagulans TaxID=686666 RepID=A0A261EVF3_9BIFI|nr:lipoate--protein ligase family protein [Bombiscardovia coagulans]OZG50626.1 Biotin/lipoate A/B protein ligase family [Bombiscardovia coagulans]